MEGGLIFFTAQWFTIQPDLFGRIEDEVGELGESEKEFIRICTTALNSGRFAKYRWCGNGHPPSSRVAIFMALHQASPMSPSAQSGHHSYCP